MKTHRLIPVAALIALAGMTMGAGCPTVPKLEKRIVEVAAGGSYTQAFDVSGASGSLIDNVTIHASDFNLAQIVSDAGLESGDVQGFKLTGVAYRITIADPNPHAINGTIGVDGTTLLTLTDQSVSAVTDWQRVDLNPAAVTTVNAYLQAVLDDLNNGTSGAGDLNLAINGTLSPGTSSTFSWELKLEFSVKGKLKEITVLS